jgi:serine/threonine-protein kinase
MSVTCPHCKAPLADEARFCPACGKANVSTEQQPSASGPIRAQADLVGREVAGRFRILSKIGEGGMGAVYRGEQMSLKRAVAVKMLRPELSANQMLLQRFQTEAQAVAKLDHPNTVKVYDFGQDTDGSLFIAMEFIEGKALRSIIANAGPLPPARAFNIALQVAASLTDAHAHSIVHRDLKPDNVMLQDKGRQRDVVRVLDFGIAKLRDDSRQTQQAMTQAGDMLGTPQYMAPEQIRGDTIDGRTDIYALGCMIYEMVTARLPYEAPTIMAMLSKHLTENPIPPSQRRPELNLPPAIDHVVLAAMQKDVNARPPTMEQYADMLAQVLHSLPPDPNWQPSAAMSAAMPPKSAIQSVAATPQPFSALQAPTPPQQTAQVTPYVPTPQHQQSYAQPAPYTPGYAPAPYQPPAIPPTVGVAPRESRSKLPLFLILGALALGGAGVGVWAATRSSSNTPVDDHKAHIDQVDEPDKPDKPDKPDQPDKVDTPPPSKDDPWANSGTPSMPDQPARPQRPQRPATPTHEHSCEEVAAQTIKVTSDDMRKQMQTMTPEQLQAAAPQLQQFAQNLQSMYKALVDNCKQTDWSDTRRKCIMDSTTLVDMGKCT